MNDDACGASSRPSPWIWMSIASIMTIGLFLRFLFMTGPIGGDDVRYLEFMDYFLSFQRYARDETAGNRFLFLLIAGLPYRIWGHEIHSILAIILVSGITDIITVTYCYRRFGATSALFATIPLAFNAIQIICTGMMLPDPLLSLCLLVAVLFFQHSLEEGERRKRLWKFALFGFLTTLCYSCKETAIILVPFAACWSWYALRGEALSGKAIHLVALLGGVAVGTLLDGLLFVAYTGEFFHRYSSLNAAFAAERPGQDFLGVLHLNAMRFFKTFRSVGGWVISFQCGLVAMGLALWRASAARVCSAFGLCFLLFLFFGVSTISPWRQLPLQIRYLQPVIPFIAISLAALTSTLPWLQRKRRAMAFCGLLACFHIGVESGAVISDAGLEKDSDFLQGVRTALEILEGEGKDFYVDGYLHYVSRQSLSSSFYRRLKIIPDHGPFPEGYYIPYSKKSPSPSDDSFRIKLRFNLDWRIANRFRTGKPKARSYGEVVVYEKVGGQQPP